MISNKLKNKLKDIYFKEQFNPRYIGVFINPFYFARKNLYKNRAKLSGNLKGKLLDIGCGNKPYEHLFKVDSYLGIEIYTAKNRKNKADLFYDGRNFPFPDETFDSILATEVFEHVFNPDEFLKEVNRIMKKGGKLLITVLFVWEEHEQPYDYARYTYFGLQYILEKNGFKIIDHIRSCDGFEVIFQLINVYIFKKTITSSKFLNLWFIVMFTAPINIVGLGLSKILPRNKDLYLDNIILAEKTRDVE
ncbi:MAG: class I SAM-dependent methyltransferase [Minisyncoccia bacterium]